MGLFENMFGKNNDGNQGGKLAQLMEAWKTDLNLTDDQVNKIHQAVKEFRGERKELKAEGGDHAQIREAREKVLQEIVTFLDDKQKQIFQANAAKYDSILHGGK